MLWQRTKMNFCATCFWSIFFFGEIFFQLKFNAFHTYVPSLWSLLVIFSRFVHRPHSLGCKQIFCVCRNHFERCSMVWSQTAIHVFLRIRCLTLFDLADTEMKKQSSNSKRKKDEQKMKENSFLFGRFDIEFILLNNKLHDDGSVESINCRIQNERHVRICFQFASRFIGAWDEWTANSSSNGVDDVWNLWPIIYIEMNIANLDFVPFHRIHFDSVRRDEWIDLFSLITFWHNQQQQQTKKTMTTTSEISTNIKQENKIPSENSNKAESNRVELA